MLRKLLRDKPAVIIAACVVVTAILLAGAPFFSNASQPNHWGGSLLAMQFVQNVSDAELILGEAPSPDREVMRFKMYVDYAFIASYLALFVYIGRRFPNARLASACGIGTAACDFVENRAILSVVDAPLGQTTQEMVDLIRHFATVKWALAGVAIILLLSSVVRHRAKVTN